MPRRVLKSFIEDRGLQHADCVGMGELRERARQAWFNPRRSMMDLETPVQRIKRVEKERKEHITHTRNKSLARERELANAPGRLLRRRSSASMMTLRTDTERSQKRHVTFDPKKGKLGLSLEGSSCMVATIRENTQSYWSGVRPGWIIRKINGDWVDHLDVKIALKAAVKNRFKKPYTIHFDTHKGRDARPLKDNNPRRKSQEFGNTAFQNTYDTSEAESDCRQVRRNSSRRSPRKAPESSEDEKREVFEREIVTTDAETDDNRRCVTDTDDNRGDFTDASVERFEGEMTDTSVERFKSPQTSARVVDDSDVTNTDVEECILRDE